MPEFKVPAARLVNTLVSLGVETARDWSVAKLEQKINDGSGIAKYRDGDAPIADPDLEQCYQDVVAAQSRGDFVVPEGDAPEPDTFSLAEPAEAPLPVDAERDENTTPESEPALPVQSTVVPTTNTEPEAPSVISSPSAARTTAKKPGRPAKKTQPEPSGAGRKRTPGRPPADAPYAKKRAFWASNPITITKQGPGVMRTVIKELKAAGKGVESGKTPKPVTKKDVFEVLKLEFPDRSPEKMWTNLNNIIPCRLREHYSIHVWRQKTVGGEMGYYIVGDGSKPQPGTSYGPREAKPAPKKPKKAAKPAPTGKKRGRPRKTAVR